MRHRRARRLLPSLLDQTLTAREEADVRRHAQRCRRCRPVWLELVLAEELLGELPPVLVPLEPTLVSESRLAGLARWAADPAPRRPEQVGLPVLGAAAAAALLWWLLLPGAWSPPPRDPGRPVVLASVLPEARLLPTGLR
jgi:hypothetical protein